MKKITLTILLYLFTFAFAHGTDRDPPNFAVNATQASFDALGLVTGALSRNAFHGKYRYTKGSAAFASSVFLFNATGIAIGAQLENDNIEPPSLVSTYAVGALSALAVAAIDLPLMLIMQGFYEPGPFIQISGIVGAIANHLYYGINRKQLYDSNEDDKYFRIQFQRSM